MPIQITFTDDVVYVSTAANADSSLRWHVYERPQPSGNGFTVYVQREVGGVLQPEVRLLAEGNAPKVFFDIDSSEWVVQYTLNENLFVIRFAELEVPAPQPTQVGTLVDHFSLRPAEAEDPTTFGERAASAVIAVKSGDAFAGPPPMESVGVGSNGSGGQWVVRWIPTAQFEDVIVGFNVYVRDGSTGAFIQLAGPVPFTGIKLYEVAVPAGTGGTYYVTQLNRRGTSSSVTIEYRIRAPYDFIPSDAINDTLFAWLGGEGHNLAAERIDKTPIIMPTQFDLYKDVQMGEGRNFDSAKSTVFPLVLPVQSDQYKDVQMGEGRNFNLNRTGTGGVIIG